MTIDLPENLESSLREAVRSGHFASMDDAMTEAALLLLKSLRQTPAAASPLATSEERVDGSVQPIWEIIEEENRSIPPEVWDDLPTDLSEEHDHYLYGTPKRHDA